MAECLNTSTRLVALDRLSGDRIGVSVVGTEPSYRDAMGRPDEVAAGVLSGLTPSQIASELGIAYSSTLDYLERAVARGIIRRSDVLFTLPPEIRSSPVNREDADIVERFGSVAHAMGDLYEDLRELETMLH